MNDEVPQKCCTACGEVFPGTPEFFYRNKRGKDGLLTQCKSCIKAYKQRPEVLERDRILHRQPKVRERQRIRNQRPDVKEKRRVQLREHFRSDQEARLRRNAYKRAHYNPDTHKRYRETHREYLRDLNKAWRERNAEYDKQRHQIYRETHLEQVRERNRIRRRERYKAGLIKRNPAKEREYTRKSRSKNPEKYRMQNKRWRERNAEYNRMRQKLDRAKHAERYKMQHRNWSKTHRAQRVLSAAHYHARKKGAPGSYTAAQIQDQLKRQKYRCYYLRCGQTKFPKDKKGPYGYRFHIEHVIPISRTEYEPHNDMSNIVLACVSCNESKRDKLPHEWIEGGRLF